MTPETPRTEALWVGLQERHWGRGDQPICDIMQSHEQLEHELDFESKVAKQIHAANEQLKAKIAAERALADRLLAITEKAVSDHEGTLHCDCGCKCSGRRIANDNAEALAAWKEARRGTD